MDQHHIDETRLVTRRSARDQILLSWSYECAYCRSPLGRSATLDHVIPKAHGGTTTRNNLVACCWACNCSKSAAPWVVWYRRQPFWSALGEWAIARWVAGEQ